MIKPRDQNQSQRFFRLNSWLNRPLQLLAGVFIILSFQQLASASPFGQGNFDADAPFGADTSISIALGGNANLLLTPSGSNFVASGSSTVTVTSNDVSGYDLYIYNPGSSALTNGSTTIPASSNVTEAPLAINSWGYNTDGSTNYSGLTTDPILLASSSGPVISGQVTTVTFGVLTSIATPEGAYSGTITYTAVAPNE